MSNPNYSFMKKAHNKVNLFCHNNKDDQLVDVLTFEKIENLYNWSFRKIIKRQDETSFL